jgi:hypothetical protein
VWGDARIFLWDHTARSTYHALQAQFRARFGRGSQFQASYTLSRTFASTALDAAPGDGIYADTVITDLGNPGLDLGPDRMDRRHMFNASLVLGLPAFEGRGRVVRNVFGDWRFGTIVLAQSGMRLTVYTPSLGGAVPVINPFGTGYAANNRPLRVPGQPCRAQGGAREQILNPLGWTMTGFRLGTTEGVSGRGVCAGPDHVQVDMSLSKEIRLSRKLTAQLRLEVFNVFNRANFLIGSVNNRFIPDVTLDTDSLATATTITTSALPAGSTFGKASGTRDPREAQIGIKLIY